MTLLRAFLLPFLSIPSVMSDRQLRKLALIPWLINIFVFIGAFASFGILDHWLMERLAAAMGTGWWVPIVKWFLMILLMAGFGAGLALSFTYLANIFSSVFSENLSRQTEIIDTGIDRPSPEGNFAAIFIRSAIEELKGVAFFLAVWLVLLLLNLIPVLGQVLFVTASAVWGALSMTFEFTAPTLERHGLRFKEKKALIFSNPLTAAAFGSGILFLALIPFINMFFLPFAVVAGTRWVLERGANNRNIQ